jgi:nitroimidazol reductase NimA-like FMN-containing flavoprotein (pyridoxamine 5'-phosphate oxidase superfamily)
MPPSTRFPVTPTNEVRRKPERGDYNRDAAYAILDEAFLAHVGIALDGEPVVIPMVFGRDGDRLLLHGSVASRLLRALDRGVPVCVTATLVDGLVLARSQRNHSVNYRSVVVFGTARRLRGRDAARALAVVVDHAIPGRSEEAIPADDREVAETLVLDVPIEVASVKVRTGPPLAAKGDDTVAEVWTGVLPLALIPQTPRTDVATSSTDVPARSVSPWRRQGSARNHVDSDGNRS